MRLPFTYFCHQIASISLSFRYIAKLFTRPEPFSRQNIPYNCTRKAYSLSLPYILITVVLLHIAPDSRCRKNYYQRAALLSTDRSFQNVRDLYHTVSKASSKSLASKQYRKAHFRHVPKSLKILKRRVRFCRDRSREATREIDYSAHAVEKSSRRILKKKKQKIDYVYKLSS